MEVVVCCTQSNNAQHPPRFMTLVTKAENKGRVFICTLECGSSEFFVVWKKNDQLLQELWLEGKVLKIRMEEESGWKRPLKSVSEFIIKGSGVQLGNCFKKIKVSTQQWTSSEEYLSQRGALSLSTLVILAANITSVRVWRDSGSFPWWRLFSTGIILFFQITKVFDRTLSVTDSG